MWNVIRGNLDPQLIIARAWVLAQELYKKSRAKKTLTTEELAVDIQDNSVTITYGEFDRILVRAYRNHPAKKGDTNATAT